MFNLNDIKNYKMMKQTLKNLFIAVGLVLIATSCYDEYKVDYEFSGTYFSMQSPLRTLLYEEGEDMTFEFGAMVSGRYENTSNETVDFMIDPSMLDGIPELEMLPEKYYSLSHESEITIPSGEKLGTVTVTIDQSFVDDANAHLVHYALPIKMLSTSLDSITSGMDSTIIAIRYQNKYYGAYRVKGVDYITEDPKNGKDTTTYSVEDFSQNAYTVTGSLSTDTVTLPYVGSDVSGNNTMKLGIAADGSLMLSEHLVDSGNYIDGTGNYDAANKSFTISYTYEKLIMPDANDPSTFYYQKHLVNDELFWFVKPQDLETWR